MRQKSRKLSHLIPIFDLLGFQKPFMESEGDWLDQSKHILHDSLVVMTKKPCSAYVAVGTPKTDTIRRK